MKKHFLIICAGILISFSCISQDENENNIPVQNQNLIAEPPPAAEYFYRGSIEGGGGIIFPVTNKAFRISFVGEYYAHLSANYIFVRHIFAGIEFENTEFGSPGLAQYNTQLFIYNAGLKVGYYTYMQHDFLFCYSLSLGPSLITYIYAPNPPPRGGFKQQSFFFTPNVLAGYRVNDELRIGLEFSYILLAYRFDPMYTGISKTIVYNRAKDINAPTSYVEIGFGFYWAFAYQENK